MAKDRDSSKRYEEAKKLHKRGVDGDKKAVREAYELFASLRTREPGNALIEAFYGSTLTLLGRDAIQPLDKAEKAQNGLEALDRAVSMDPHQKRIRLLRGNVCMKLPEAYFQSSKTAIEDFTYLLDRYHEDPEYLNKKQAIEIMRNLSKAYMIAGQPGEAEAVLQRLVKLHKKK